MTAVFLCGALRHPDLRGLVLGNDYAVRPVRLADHAVRAGARDALPLLVPAPTATAEGLLCDPDAAALDRLDYYAGGHGQIPQILEVQTDDGPVAARAYLAEGETRAGDWEYDDWEYDDWVTDGAALTLATAREVMAHFGRFDLPTLRRWLPRMRARAWARILARHGRPSTSPDLPAPGAVRIDRVERKHSGFFALDDYRLSHPRFGGGRTGTLAREAFISSDAALVLPYDAATDRLVLIEQFRMGPTARHDPNPWIYEPVAGLVDPGESPEETARREAIEETGLTLDALEPMMRAYASPGNATEFFHCFLGHCRLEGAARWTGGVAEEEEDIRSHVMSYDRAMALLDGGEINAAPLAMMLLWLARHRARLRASS